MPCALPQRHTFRLPSLYHAGKQHESSGEACSCSLNPAANIAFLSPCRHLFLIRNQACRDNDIVCLLVQVSEAQLSAMGALGAGLLVGTALAVIIPEGFHAFQSAQHETGVVLLHPRQHACCLLTTDLTTTALPRKLIGMSRKSYLVRMFDLYLGIGHRLFYIPIYMLVSGSKWVEIMVRLRQYSFTGKGWAHLPRYYRSAVDKTLMCRGGYAGLGDRGGANSGVCGHAVAGSPAAGHDWGRPCTLACQRPHPPGSLQ